MRKLSVNISAEIITLTELENLDLAKKGWGRIMFGSYIANDELILCTERELLQVKDSYREASEFICYVETEFDSFLGDYCSLEQLLVINT